ncbi:MULTISPECIES: D-TA family PLP-dependent enzyme [Sphingobacterium]|uniref:D-TA family PLP-dependent enzyme n=1 Tax=Sphingobacterium TaxID=28453 RepID=UPI0013DADE8C|nr:MULTISPECIES: D-TA family PLP-dependent enzyme [unclassified Sphingobacterium]
MQHWYEVIDVESIDSPALLVYPERIRANIQFIKSFVNGACSRLRPHVKTNKMVEVCKMMIEEDIQQFKCSTIAEAEMLALSNARDVLMAYQPVGPKLDRWIQLIKAYPNTHFSCILDNVTSIEALGQKAGYEGLSLSVYLDIDVGMGRTGAAISDVFRLWDSICQYDSLLLKGVHGYDGHICNPDQDIRLQESELSYNVLKQAFDYLQQRNAHSLEMVIGGSPSFSSHAKRSDVVCSPGTFVFWDWGYRERIPEQPFVYAAVLLTRVISIISPGRICVDLGYKAVASDPPLPRVQFLNADGLEVLFQSEEHLVLSVDDSSQYPIGTELYAVPTHICPTVNLYSSVSVIQKHRNKTTWQVVGRNRKLNI